MESQDIPPVDWELTEDYYQNRQDMPELKLEDFMDEGETESVSGKFSQEQAQRFQ